MTDGGAAARHEAEDGGGANGKLSGRVVLTLHRSAIKMKGIVVDAE